MSEHDDSTTLLIDLHIVEDGSNVSVIVNIFGTTQHDSSCSIALNFAFMRLQFSLKVSPLVREDSIAVSAPDRDNHLLSLMILEYKLHSILRGG